MLVIKFVYKLKFDISQNTFAKKKLLQPNCFVPPGILISSSFCIDSNLTGILRLFEHD